eukprot:300734_1
MYNSLISQKKEKVAIWFKSSIHKTINKYQKHGKPQTPHTQLIPNKAKNSESGQEKNKYKHKQKPNLIFAGSADKIINKRLQQLQDRNVSDENKCYTEMNSSHPCKAIWCELNVNNHCNANIMAIEATSKCINNNNCTPSKRIEFILSNLHNNIKDDTLSDNKLLEFISIISIIIS